MEKEGGVNEVGKDFLKTLCTHVGTVQKHKSFINNSDHTCLRTLLHDFYATKFKVTII